MDKYLQCIYDYLEENELYWAMQGEEEYTRYNRDANKKKDALRKGLTEAQGEQLEHCCNACMMAQKGCYEKFFEFGVAVGKYMAR